MPISFTELDPSLGGTTINEDVNSGALFFNDEIPNILGLPVWVTATAYVLNDIVYDAVGKQYYICVLAHTSGATIAGDLATKWDEYTNTQKLYTGISELEADGINSLVTNTSWKDEYYQVQSLFNMNINAKLYTNIFPVPAVSYTFEEIYNAQIQADGKIRQMFVFANEDALSTANVIKIQEVLNRLDAENMPLFVVYGPKTSTSFATVASLPDLTELATSCPDVHVLIGQDGAGKGFTLSPVDNPAVGALVGSISKGKVNENPAWIGGYDYRLNDDLDTVILTNGLAIKGMSISDLALLNNKGYGYFYRENGKIGTYLKQAYTCDKKRIINGTEQVRQLIPYRRTMHKVKRQVRLALLPYVNYSFEVTTSGKLASTSVSLISGILNNVLGSMKSAGELNSYSFNIDQTNNVIADQTIFISIKLVPFAYAKEMEITLQYAIINS